MAYTDSTVAEGQLDLIGVWIHDPDDPAGTIRSYPYGASARERVVDTMGTSSFYAGRMSPLVDYGEFEGEAVACSVQIPHGLTWFADVEAVRVLASAKRTMWYRDNRGRVLPGTLSGYREADQDWGTLVSFTVTRVDFPLPVTAEA